MQHLARASASSRRPRRARRRARDRRRRPARSSCCGRPMRSTSTWMNDSRRALGVVGDAGKRAVGAALDRDDRVHDQVQRQPVPVDFHRHRIDQERHVVVDDLDDRVRRLPAMFFDRRIEHAHPRASRVALAREIPVRQRRAVQVRGLPLGEVLRVELAEVALDEGLQRLALFRRDLGAHHAPLEHGPWARRPGPIGGRFNILSFPSPQSKSTPQPRATDGGRPLPRVDARQLAVPSRRSISLIS